MEKNEDISMKTSKTKNEMGENKIEKVPETYTDSQGYTYKRKKNLFLKKNGDKSYYFVCKKSKCAAMLTYSTIEKSMMPSKNFVHTCKLEEHTMKKKFHTKIDNKIVENMEKNIKQVEMN
jgi:hypothetical protein